MLEQKDHLRFCIADNGEGMSDKQQKSIFSRNIHSQMGTESGAGSGLGLLLSREFANLHKGQISVQSSVGKGSIFTLQIPCKLNI